jgi:acyl carrier protein
MEPSWEEVQAEKLIHYLVHEVLRRPDTKIQPDSPLVSSGLIDSLALVNVLTELENLTQRRIPAGKVRPKDMDTVRLMLATAYRVGKPRH